MRKYLILFSFFLSLIACKNDDDGMEIPECLKVTVEAILDKPVQSPKAKIEKWSYEGQEVYLVAAQNFPDGETFIIDTDCQDTICTLGGLDGSDNDCPNWQNAVFIETIWIDSR